MEDRLSREEHAMQSLARVLELPIAEHQALPVERILESALKVCCFGPKHSSAVVLGHLQGLVRVRERSLHRC
jgi:hypothetical protein